MIDDDQDAGDPEAGAPSIDPIAPSADAWQYRTPESLFDMETDEPDKLEKLIFDGLHQVREAWIIDEKKNVEKNVLLPFDSKSGSATWC